ncbi:hypothetical protein FACS189438_0290 [Bacteroidia bacterium]|nr:hypothetical protein FACS189438_0290 [Bacteroidia bacterium]
MKYILLTFLIILCIYPFFSIKKDKTKLYQLPCLFGIVTLGMICSTLVMNVFSVSGLSEDAFNLYTFNACLCLMCAYKGYSLPVKNISKTNHYDEKKLLMIASVYVIICILIQNKIDELTGGMNFTEGMPVVLVFFGRLLRPTTILIIFLFLRKFSYYKLALVVILLGLSISGVLVRGRRSEFFMFFFTISLPLFFVKGFIPYKKLYLITAFIAGMAVYILLPVWRSHNLEYYGSDVLGEKVDYRNAAINNLKGEETNDVLEATYTQYAVMATGEYNYGADFYNHLVFQFASRTLFGEGLKQKLMVNKVDLDFVRSQVGSTEWGYFKGYVTKTGFTDVFMMFSYFGCLVYFFFARIAKRMWYDAIYTDDILHKVFYSYFAVMFICSAIYGSLSFMGITLIQFLFFYLPVKYFSKIRIRQ